MGLWIDKICVEKKLNDLYLYYMMEKNKYIKPDCELIMIQFRQFMALSDSWHINGGTVMAVEKEEIDDEFLDLD